MPPKGSGSLHRVQVEKKERYDGAVYFRLRLRQSGATQVHGPFRASRAAAMADQARVLSKPVIGQRAEVLRLHEAPEKCEGRASRRRSASGWPQPEQLPELS